MSEKIYGVNPDEKLTPFLIRDAVVECLRQAYNSDLGFDSGDPNKNLDFCRSETKKAFANSGGDFDNTTKSSILNAMGELKKFAGNFCDPNIAKEHCQKMMGLIEKLDSD